MKNAASPKRPVKTLSLFSGAGGLDIGFHRAGFDIVAAVEIEPAYAATLRENSGPGKFFGPSLTVHCEDIRLFDPTPYMNAGIECIIGGPPCQTFSAAGRRSGGVLGTDDDRGTLFEAYVEILKALNPRVFVFENVYGLPGANGGGPWREIVSAFAAAGYELTAEVLDAADYGTPQHRERLIMVGCRKGLFRLPLPTHGPDSPAHVPFVTAQASIADLQDPREPMHSGPGGMYGHLLPLVPEGLNYSFFTAEMGHPRPQFAWRSKFHDFLHKADPDAPVRTIKSKPGKFTGPFHWKNRHFTAQELKRLQSFPDEYVIVGSYNKVVEQIGNSVPPALALAIATSVREQLIDGSPPTQPLRPDGFQSTFRQRQRERNAHFKKVADAAISTMTLEQLGDLTRETDTVEVDNYQVGFIGWFKREFASSVVRKDHDRVLSVSTSRGGAVLEVDLAQAKPRVLKKDVVEVRIQIAGLKKYMGHTDEVLVDASVSDVGDLLPIWAVIEHELVRRSEFFSLIDIYGHYANRGDSVVIETEILNASDSLASAVQYFANSRNCGVALTLKEAADALGVHQAQMSPLVERLRSLRWDVRTHRTHPTLASDALLCTYPFPSLSQKAHFDKRLTSITLPGQAVVIA